MRYRKQTSSGDYIFGGSQLDFYRDVPEAPGQAVKTRLLLWLGEWFLDISDGTQYMLGILGKHSKFEADTTIQQRILGTQGVTQIDNYDSVIDPVTRGMTVTCKISTIYGPTDFEITNYTQY